MQKTNSMTFIVITGSNFAIRPVPWLDRHKTRDGNSVDEMGGYHPQCDNGKGRKDGLVGPARGPPNPHPENLQKG